MYNNVIYMYNKLITNDPRYFKNKQYIKYKFLSKCKNFEQY